MGTGDRKPYGGSDSGDAGSRWKCMTQQHGQQMAGRRLEHGQELSLGRTSRRTRLPDIRVSTGATLRSNTLPSPIDRLSVEDDLYSESLRASQRMRMDVTKREPICEE